MRSRILEYGAVAIVVAGAFVAGRSLEVLDAQDRPGLPVQPPPVDPVLVPREDEILLFGEDNNVAAGNGNGILAVTGSYGVGTSVLYVVDPATKQLAVYEARGGSPSMRRVVFVGARRIDLDLQLEGYNDQSEFDYEQLRARFDGPTRPRAPSTLDRYGLRGSETSKR